MPKCKICGKLLLSINASHLKTHGMTKDEYKTHCDKLKEEAKKAKAKPKKAKKAAVKAKPSKAKIGFKAEPSKKAVKAKKEAAKPPKAKKPALAPHKAVVTSAPKPAPPPKKVAVAPKPKPLKVKPAPLMPPTPRSVIIRRVLRRIGVWRGPQHHVSGGFVANGVVAGVRCTFCDPHNKLAIMVGDDSSQDYKIKGEGGWRLIRFSNEDLTHRVTTCKKRLASWLREVKIK